MAFDRAVSIQGQYPNPAPIRVLVIRVGGADREIHDPVPVEVVESGHGTTEVISFSEPAAEVAFGTADLTATIETSIGMSSMTATCP